MAKFFPALTDSHQHFIRRQKIFFSASAPESGRVNVSPKGMDSFRVLDDTTVAYLDLTGSGNETAAHVLQNQRLTLMFCAFEGDPLILRLYGKGEVIAPHSVDWPVLIKHFDVLAGTRQIIKLNIDSVQTSCGFGVPHFQFIGERDELLRWANKKGETGLTQYRQEKNCSSIDGLDIPIDYK